MPADPISGFAILSTTAISDLRSAVKSGLGFFTFDSADGSTHIYYSMTADCRPI